MGQGRQYEAIDSHNGGKRSALVLAFAIVCCVAILVAAVFLGIKLSSLAGQDEAEAPSPPPPVPMPEFTVNLTSPLQMALLFMEAQKSGNLPDDYPFTWRNNSGLTDGFDQNRNLTGGFYDGGGTVKYTYPIAFSVTMLSWAVLDYGDQFDSVGQADEAISLIQWGVDYLLAVKYENIIFAQVGIPEIDESCWTRPEDMLRRHRITPFPCEPAHPCSDLAGEMAAALAAASIIFRDPKKGNPVYADQIVATAEELWSFADAYRGKYSDWVVTAQAEYNSTGYLDELFWGAAWLYYATGNEKKYLEYLMDGQRMSEYMESPPATAFEEPMLFNWDKKSPGVAVLLTRLLTMGFGADQEANATNTVFARLTPFAYKAINYVAQFLPLNTKLANFTTSDGNKLTWGGPREKDIVRPLEIAVNTAYLSMVLVDYLKPTRTTNLTTGLASYYIQGSTLDDVIAYFISQRNYMIGDNDMKMSYMVGWKGRGTSYPTNVYHKGASIPSYWFDKEKYTCVSGNFWLETPSPNPITLIGALVGGPDRNDTYFNDRMNRNHSEPKTHVNAVWAGFLAGTMAESARPGIWNYDRMWPKLPWAAKKARQIEKLLARYAPPPPSNGTAPPPPVFDPNAP